MAQHSQGEQYEDEMLNWGRLLLDGLPFADVLGARDRGEHVSWFDYWMSVAERYEHQAEQALVEEHELSAGEWFVIGALAAQYGQFLCFDQRRSVGQARKVELYRRGAPYLNPPAERVDVPFEGVTIPCYLRLPRATSNSAPCAILLGGLESTKEESYAFENLVLARGVATFTFDGPGQGELLADVRLSGDFERYTTRVIDYLEKRDEIDPSRLGVLGRSLGANYALRSAALDHRLVACVAWGLGIHMDNWDTEPPATKESWRYVSKVATLDEARDYVRQVIDVRPVLDKLGCATYGLHGALDTNPIEMVNEFRSLATMAPLTVVVEPHGNHCCHNLGPMPRVRMADWLSNQLRRA
ncbi:MAG: alpha/beta hydrolase family protein [Acidimicrobiales bacterium]